MHKIVITVPTILGEVGQLGSTYYNLNMHVPTYYCIFNFVFIHKGLMRYSIYKYKNKYIYYISISILTGLNISIIKHIKPINTCYNPCIITFGLFKVWAITTMPLNHSCMCPFWHLCTNLHVHIGVELLGKVKGYVYILIQNNIVKYLDLQNIWQLF